eukprot:TRINITY_DN2407_c0_g1_i2.p1 TRINITY_DN2407_c0_g1~~TRINITY_DN2407_c0_g1_i2.p1  ORF type:complete len:148 (+),score=11.05 TRINITY_DN2407_c0_g1_i2:438-881(+)
MTSPGEPADFPGIRRAFDSSVDDPLAPDDHEDIEAPEPPRPKPSAQHSSSQEAERLLERSRERLNNTLRLAEESEMVGSDVLTRLAADRDIIDRNLSRTAGTAAELARSQRTITAMRRRVLMDNAWAFCAVIAAVVVICILIYMRFR